LTVGLTICKAVTANSVGLEKQRSRAKPGIAPKLHADKLRLPIGGAGLSECPRPKGVIIDPKPPGVSAHSGWWKILKFVTGYLESLDAMCSFKNGRSWNGRFRIKRPNSWKYIIFSHSVETALCRLMVRFVAKSSKTGLNPRALAGSARLARAPSPSLAKPGLTMPPRPHPAVSRGAAL
jgi:hypothetical protein